MKDGDHVYIYCISKEGLKYTHHGIYCGSDKIIHYYDGKVKYTTTFKFGLKGRIRIKQYKKCDKSSIVIKRAKARLGEKAYNLVFNNCEHFACWCKTGIHKSKQVDKALPKLIKSLNKKAGKELEQFSLPKIPKLKAPKMRFKPKIPKLKAPKIRFKW